MHGCGRWSNRWTSHGHPLPATDVFTLQLDERLATPSNDMICHACWKRHADHCVALDGRVRVVPSRSPLDVLLSVMDPAAASSSSSPLSSSLPSTPAVILSPSSSSSAVLPSPFPGYRVALPISTTPIRRSHTTPPVLGMSLAPSTYSERQSVVVANVLAGIDYERYRLQQVMLGCAPMSKDTWYTHQATVYNSIIAIAESKEVEYMQMLHAAGQRLVFCADAAWSHRGFEANQCCWLLLNAENKQIVLAVVLTKSRWEKGEEVHVGNYKGSSGGMEGTAMEKGIARLKANGLLPLVAGWVCDKDSSVSEQLRSNPDTAHIPIHYDPGHIKKNFEKSLMEIYGTGVRYQGMAARGGNVLELHSSPSAESPRVTVL